MSGKTGGANTLPGSLSPLDSVTFASRSCCPDTRYLFGEVSLAQIHPSFIMWCEPTSRHQSFQHGAFDSASVPQGPLMCAFLSPT